MSDTLLATLEAYFDAAPRSASRAEDWSPFVLFVQQGSGWPYYARPRLGAQSFTMADVAAVRARQRALGIPEAFEWVEETTPGLRAAVLAAGLDVADHPVMVWDDAAARVPAAPPSVTIRLVTPEDDFARLAALARVGFGAAGTARSEVGQEAVERAMAHVRPEEAAFTRGRVVAGLTVMALAVAGSGVVAVGSHQPVGRVSEVAGIATLPAYRRRGIAAALTRVLADDARQRGSTTIFLSAGDAVIGRVYERVGFRRVGTACAGEPAETM